jgi:flagellar basal body rod protein FlgG
MPATPAGDLRRIERQGVALHVLGALNNPGARAAHGLQPSAGGTTQSTENGKGVDMPIRGIENSAHALGFYLRMQEVAANNLANANTDAFKVDRVTAHQLPGGRHPVPVHATDLGQGTFRETARALDLALDGPGFLVVGTSNGDRLMRGGSLRLDQAGQLTDAHGAPLLDVEGHSLVLSGSEIAVHGDGTVLVDGASAGRLRVVIVDDPHTLSKEGEGRFVASTPLKAADATTEVRQGAIEEANLDPILSMIDMITIQRAYSANVEALKAMDQVLGTVTRQVGKL